MQELIEQFQSSYPPAENLQEANQFLSLKDIHQIIIQMKMAPLSEDEAEELYQTLRSRYKTEQLGQVSQYLIK